ncbi:MAG: hypothetical protein FWE37_04380 [Spirochaetaceae bacterium]|nr:hypothetical protein [Spirochaetaceae bacterium]
MEEGQLPIVVIGRESFIGNKLNERLNLEGRIIVNLGGGEYKNGNVIAWNRGSRISAKTAVRELKRRYGMADEVFIIFGRKWEDSFPESPFVLIEEVIDNELKGLFFMVQELYLAALQAGQETAFYFISEEIFDGKRPLSTAAAAGFKGYAQAIMSSNSNFYMVGFELEGQDTEGFINFVLKTTANRPHKRQNSWQVYPKGNKLFGR